ncbi:MAG: Do family serine endopeptidase [Hyphomicrobium sp.]
MATSFFWIFQSPSFGFKDGPQSLAPLAEKLSDAVVNISSTQVAKNPDGIPIPRAPEGSPLQDLFEDFFSKRGGRSQQMDRKVSSLGSGFVIDGEEGLIVTNNHVIEGADEIVINFHDGTRLTVDKILGKDTKTDIALLKVTPKKPLKSVPFGSSADIKVGDWVVAIGNPFNLGGTLTVGIVSAKQRDINAGPYDDFIQTDAAINRGNSGGPLFNMDGEVIGVNTAIISPTGGSVGISFAIPSDTVQGVVEQLKKNGIVRRGWLGVKIQSVSDDLAEGLGVEGNAGALVSAVTPDSPASKAGLQPGDVILKFDGKDITTMRGLPRLVAQAPIGKSVDIEIQRSGNKKTLQVSVGQIEEEEDKELGQSKKQKQDNEVPLRSSLLGLTLTPLTKELSQQLGYDENTKGLVIADIESGSPSANKNLKVGDLILEAQKEKIKTFEEFSSVVDKMKQTGARQILLLVEDPKGDTRFVALGL